jgi:hypothetical protein
VIFRGLVVVVCACSGAAKVRTWWQQARFNLKIVMADVVTGYGDHVILRKLKITHSQTL